MDNRIVLFQLMDDKLRFAKKKAFRGHNVAGYACSVDFSPDMRYYIFFRFDRLYLHFFKAVLKLKFFVIFCVWMILNTIFLSWCVFFIIIQFFLVFFLINATKFSKKFFQFMIKFNFQIF